MGMQDMRLECGVLARGSRITGIGLFTVHRQFPVTVCACADMVVARGEWAFQHGINVNKQ
jgi:hypothetical protein